MTERDFAVWHASRARLLLDLTRTMNDAADLCDVERWAALWSWLGDQLEESQTAEALLIAPTLAPN